MSNNKLQKLSFVDRNFPTFKAVGAYPFKSLNKLKDFVEKKSVTTGQTISRWLWGRPYYHYEFDPMIVTEKLIDALEESGWVYACVDAYNKAISTLEFTFQRWSVEKREWEPFEEHPALERFENPNPTMSGHDLVSLGLMDLFEYGNFITSISDSVNTFRDDPTLELWHINPKCVAPIPDPYKLFAGYAISPVEIAMGGETIKVVGGYRSEGAHFELPRNIVHGQLRNSDNPLWGTSAFRAIRRMIETEVEALIWNRSMLKIEPNLQGS